MSDVKSVEEILARLARVLSDSITVEASISPSTARCLRGDVEQLQSMLVIGAAKAKPKPRPRVRFLSAIAEIELRVSAARGIPWIQLKLQTGQFASMHQHSRIYLEAWMEKQGLPLGDKSLQGMLEKLRNMKWMCPWEQILIELNENLYAEARFDYNGGESAEKETEHGRDDTSAEAEG